MSELAFTASVSDFRKAERTRAHLRVGQRFVFVTGGAKPVGRIARLLGKSAGADGPMRVLPLTDQAVTLEGMSIALKPRAREPLHALVADRDLYRAEEDTVQLFIALPDVPDGLTLVVEQAGQVFSERALDPREIPSLQEHGVHIEPLSMLLPGDYSAQLALEGARIGQPARFTVASYTLAPLTGRLLAHSLDRASDRLTFSLAVESYELPYEGALRIELLAGQAVIDEVSLEALSAGRYEGALKVSGDDALRLRLIGANDPARTCEVVIPGSRRNERETTVVSELGRERLLALMPEPSALSLRGAYLSTGDYLGTPVVVDEVVCERGRLELKADVAQLHTVTINLASGVATAMAHGDKASGDVIEVAVRGPACAVFVGGFVHGKPFEGFTTLFRPARLRLQLSARHEPAMKTLFVDVESDPGRRPLLVCVRDERLTATDTPEVALSASLKRALVLETQNLGEDGGLADLSQLETWSALLPAPSFLRSDELGIMRYSSALPPGAIPSPMASGMPAARSRSARSWEESAPDDVMFCEADDDAMALDREGVAAGAPSRRETALAAPPPPSSSAAPGAQPWEPRAELAPAPPLAGRATFPEVIFYGLVEVDGRTTLELPLADALGTFTIEAFAITKDDWLRVKDTVVVDQPVRAELDVPPAVFPDDLVTATFRAAAQSGSARVSLTRDGLPVELFTSDGVRVEQAASLTTPVELRFRVLPGEHVATVSDAVTGEEDRVRRLVSEPGELKSYAREVALLQAGDRLSLADAGDDVLSLRVLPSLDATAKCLVEATADYAHLCCEQTAAKILSAALMYLSAENTKQKAKAEKIILQGIARERTMHRPGRGLAMYPSTDGPNDYWGRLAVTYLWQLEELKDVPTLSVPLARAIEEGVAIADDAGTAYGLSRVPDAMAGAEDAYRLATHDPERLPEAATFALELVDAGVTPAKARASGGAVQDRRTLAYAAAVLLRAGRLREGVRVADAVLRQLNGEGRLYSTCDSVAAIALFSELERAGVGRGPGRVTVNGVSMSLVEAAALVDQVESLEVHEGVCSVELSAIRSESWRAFRHAFDVRVGFRGPSDEKKTRFSPGERAELVVELSDGYQTGDLVHLTLPPAIACLKGGGRVQSLTVDFEGESEVRIPLLVVGAIEGRQRFAVCVRNMFEEERASNPGLLSVEGA